MGDKNLGRWVTALVFSLVLGGCLRLLDDDRQWPCDVDADCEASQRCTTSDYLQNGHCYEWSCNEDADCGGHMRCMSGADSEIACYEWPCDTQTDCGAGMRCMSDADSEIGANKCVAASACDSHQDCAGGEACLVGMCSGRFCSSEQSEVCGVYACDSSVQACREECGSESHCQTGLDCVDSVCVDLRCLVTEDSRCGLYTCEGSSMHCREVCENDEHCQGDNRCEAGQCEPPECNRLNDPACGAYLCDGATMECETECASAEECSAGSACVQTECVSQDAPGVTLCTTTDDCDGGFACDTNAGACRVMCADDTHCDRTAGNRCAENGTCTMTSIVPGVHLGGRASCHLGETGIIRCWGSVLPLFPGASYRNMAIADVACAQHLDGSLSCHAPYEHYESEVESQPDFESMDASGHYVCGLAAGEVHCFDRGISVGVVLSSVEAMAVTTVFSSDGGRGGVCGISQSGNLKCTPEAPKPPAGIYSKLDCSDSNCCAISIEGKVECWGDNNYNQAEVPELTSLPVALVATSYTSCALLEDGTVQCWGSLESTAQFSRSDLPPVVEISGHDIYICARTLEDIVYCWANLSSSYAVPAILEPGDSAPNQD